MKTAMNEWIEWLNAYSFELPLELQIKATEILTTRKTTDHRCLRCWINGKIKFNRLL